MPLTTIGMAGLAEEAAAFTCIILVGFLVLSNAMALLSWNIKSLIGKSILAIGSLQPNIIIFLLTLPALFAVLSPAQPGTDEFDGDVIHWNWVFLSLMLFAIVSTIFSVFSIVNTYKSRPHQINLKQGTADSSDETKN
jgi:hypothetical protein